MINMYLVETFTDKDKKKDKDRDRWSRFRKEQHKAFS